MPSTSSLSYEHSGVQFLRTELDTGSTLASIAQKATRENKKQRNRVNARKAYDSILHFLPGTVLTGDEAEEIKLGLEELRLTLVSLGEEL